MNMKSRKFLAWLVGMVVLAGVLVLLVFKAPEQIGGFMPWFVIGLIFLTALMVGGAVWSDYVKSKYFRPELAEASEKIGVLEPSVLPTDQAGGGK
jgi:hypothetical protein